MTPAELREVANDTLAQTGPNVFGSAAWFRRRANVLANEVLALLDRIEGLEKDADRLHAFERRHDLKLEDIENQAMEWRNVAAGEAVRAQLAAVTAARDELSAIAAAHVDKRLDDIAHIATMSDAHEIQSDIKAASDYCQASSARISELKRVGQ